MFLFCSLVSVTYRNSQYDDMTKGLRTNNNTITTTTVLRPFDRDYPGEPVAEETLTHPPSWSSSNLYQLLPSTMIHSILPVQVTCLAIFMHNLFPCPLWSTSWSGALHLIFHTFLHPKPILRNTTSFSALTLLVGSFDPQKPSPKWPIMCLVGR